VVLRKPGLPQEPAALAALALSILWSGKWLRRMQLLMLMAWS